MNTVSRKRLTTIALGYATVTLASCTSMPQEGYEIKKGGSDHQPFQLGINLAENKCPPAKVEPVVHFGAVCDEDHPGAICVERGQSINWRSTGKKIQKVDFINKPDPLENKTALPSKSFRGRIKQSADLGVYEYEIGLERCADIDPKIIITN